MSVKANKALVLEMKAAFNRLDWPAFLSFLSEDVRFYTIGSTKHSGLFIGRENFWNQKLKPMVDQMDESLGFEEDVTRIVAEGDIVVAESRGRETLKNGQEYNNEYCIVYKIRDGQISEWTSYLDTDLIARTHE